NNHFDKVIGPKSLTEVTMFRRFLFLVTAYTLFAVSCFADCSNLPNFSQLKTALVQATNDETSGLNMNMWATIVDRDGIVCAVAFTGTNRGAQWPGSRVISAQ